MGDLDTTQTSLSQERFDPDSEPGTLIEAEHRARYWCAVQWAAGRRVLDAGCGTGYGLAMLLAAGAEAATGVDLSDEAVADATRRLGGNAEIVRGDVCSLPFDDDAFDVVVCLEVIEHVERQRDALDDLKRVLRPDGVLLVSSPNRDVYPPGNPHHVHEYRPVELQAELQERFANVRLYRQHPWLASALLPDETLARDQPRQALAAMVGESRAPGAETFTLAVASDAELAAQTGVVALGDDFEVRWWNDRVDRLGREAHRSARLAEELRAEVGRLSRALLESEQAAARVVELERRLADLEDDYDRATQHGGYCERVIDDMQDSVSWRLTAPIRLLKKLLSRSRSRSAP